MPGIPGQGKGRVLSEEWRTKIRAGLARYWARHRMPMEERLRRSNERGRRWAQEHGGLDGIYKRRHHLRTYYGLTLEEYDALYAAQNGCCAMCRQPRRILEVDHCHSTGKVRGLLCPSCNRGLTWIERSGFVNMAKAYLAKHEEKTNVHV